MSLIPCTPGESSNAALVCVRTTCSAVPAFVTLPSSRVLAQPLCLVGCLLWFLLWVLYCFHGAICYFDATRTPVGRSRLSDGGFASRLFGRRYESEGRCRKTIKAQTLWYSIIESQTETGTPYMLYKDACNKKSNQQNLGTIKCSNLCTEIVQFSSPSEVIAVRSCSPLCSMT